MAQLLLSRLSRVELAAIEQELARLTDLIITMDFATAALAIFALKPLRKRWLHVQVSRRGALPTEDAQHTKAAVRLAPDGRPA